MTSHDVMVVGAGLAGLQAARTLQAAGKRVLVLEKSRGVSGRASTRRWDGTPADHGAQFFTARSEPFRAQVADWSARGVCAEWARGFHQFRDGRLEAPDAADAHPRYVCPLGMSALGKDLARGLEVRLQSRVTALTPVAAGPGRPLPGWELNVDDEGSPAPRYAPAVILTVPVPQALTLLESVYASPPSSGLSAEGLAALQAVVVAPSLSVLRRVPAHVPAPPWRGIQLRSDDILTWIGADFSKRPRPAPDAPRIYVIHGSADFSREWIDGDLDKAARRMVGRAAEIVGDWIGADHGDSAQQVHRWRYALMVRGYGAGEPARSQEPCTLLSGPPAAGQGASGGPLLVAGDAFLGAKVEGAWRSGQAAAERLLGLG